MIVISNNLVLSAADAFGPNNPVIGWHNLVTADNISTDNEAEDYPVTNLANPITAPSARWRAVGLTGTSGIVIDVAINSVEDVDYLAIARHNLATETVFSTVYGSIDGGVTWTELVQEVLLPNNAPTIFRFEPQALTHIRLALEGGAGTPEIGVMYVGKLLVLQRRIYVGHTPIPYGRSQQVVNGKSEGGDFLGRIITSEQVATVADLQNMTPSWYREKMDPFIEASKDTPFFFAWRPQDYPYEVGFAWMTNDPQPVNQRPNGMMQIQLQMTGIAP